MNFPDDLLEQIISFRKDLHQNPELSGKEYKTTAKIKEFIILSQPDNIFTFLGITGIAAVFNGSEKGKTVLLRADIDAVPIAETNTFSYKSTQSGISHKCGHDGHTAILAGLSRLIHLNPLKKGKVVLLFQPAEETGIGANQILKNPSFNMIIPDFVFAMHNLPGFLLNEIVVKNGFITSASKGMIIRLFGKTSHAAYPESGLNPALAMAEIIRKLSTLSQLKNTFRDFILLTIVYSRLGKKAFGISPGDAQVMATLRSYLDEDMEKLSQQAFQTVMEIGDKYEIPVKISLTDEFAATINNRGCVDIIKNVAFENGFTINEIKNPFRWSEDFGYFTHGFPGAFFGIGAGEKIPGLHHPDYDFQDEIIETGIKMFDGIIRKILS